MSGLVEQASEQTHEQTREQAGQSGSVMPAETADEQAEHHRECLPAWQRPAHCQQGRLSVLSHGVVPGVAAVSHGPSSWGSLQPQQPRCSCCGECRMSRSLTAALGLCPAWVLPGSSLGPPCALCVWMSTTAKSRATQCEGVTESRKMTGKLGQAGSKRAGNACSLPRRSLHLGRPAWVLGRPWHALAPTLGPGSAAACPHPTLALGGQTLPPPAVLAAGCGPPAVLSREAAGGAGRATLRTLCAAGLNARMKLSALPRLLVRDREPELSSRARRPSCEPLACVPTCAGMIGWEGGASPWPSRWCSAMRRRRCFLGVTLAACGCRRAGARFSSQRSTGTREDHAPSQATFTPPAPHLLPRTLLLRPSPWTPPGARARLRTLAPRRAPNPKTQIPTQS